VRREFTRLVVPRNGIGLALDAVLPRTGKRPLRVSRLREQLVRRADEAAVAAIVLDAQREGVGTSFQDAVGHREHRRPRLR
jgi:hypothetical protein